MLFLIRLWITLLSSSLRGLTLKYVHLDPTSCPVKLLIKVEVKIQTSKMRHHKAGNYLKAYRKKSGLSQRDLGRLLGYKDAGQVSRHERARSNPPLAAALAYELIFRAPIASLFAGTREEILRDIEMKLGEMRTIIENRKERPSNAILVAQKLAWLRRRENAPLTN
jgi:transcriptional regulator with XRE-family HTH domain